MTFRPGDRVTVRGVGGVHTVTTVAPPTEISPYDFLDVVLAPGTVYGHRRGDDTIRAESWRCEIVPVDMEEWPCSPI